MQPKRRFWGRLVRAEGSELLRLRGTRVGEPGGESARRFRCAALVLLALLASPAVSMAAEPTPDPHPTADAPERTGTPSPDPTPAARDAASTSAAPAPAPAPAASQGPSTSAPSTPVQIAPTTRQPATTAQQPTRPRAKPNANASKQAPAADTPQRGSRQLAPQSRAVPDQIERAVAAAAARAAATAETTREGSRLLLGAFGLLTLVLASGSLLVLLARSEGWGLRT